MSLERIVRPFQTQLLTPPRRVIDGEKPVENVVLEIGKPGSGLTFLYNLFYFLNVVIKNSDDGTTHTEITRKESTRRVTNPDDPDQHLDTKVLDEVQVRKDSNPKDHTTYKFNNPTP